jgi:hypothetical protein
MPLVFDEINNLIPEWQDLVSQEEGFVAFHSILVVYLATKDPLFIKSS